MFDKITTKAKGILSLVLSLLMTVSLCLNYTPAYAASINNNDIQTFTITSSDFLKAIDDVLDGEYDLKDYDDKNDGNVVFEVSPHIKKKNVHKLSLRTFIVPDDDTLTEDTRVIFLLTNSGENTAAAEVKTDDLSTGILMVPAGDIAATLSDADAATSSDADDDEFYPDIEITEKGAYLSDRVAAVLDDMIIIEPDAVEKTADIYEGAATVMEDEEASPSEADRNKERSKEKASDEDIFYFVDKDGNGNTAFITTLDGIGISPDSVNEDIVYTAEDNGVYVTVTAPYNALPEGAELTVTVFDKDSEEYGKAAENVDDADGMLAMDISFIYDGEEIEPEEPVTVNIDVSEVLPEEADKDTIKITHLAEEDDGFIPEVVSEKNAAATFSVYSFSVFTVTWTNGSSEVAVSIYAYHINGLGIIEDELAYTWSGSSFSIDDIIALANVDEEYTFAYATVSYISTSSGSGPGGGTSLTVIGGEDNSVTGLTLSGSTITVSYGTNSSTSVTGCDADNSIEFSINLYFTTPQVTVTADNEHASSITFTAENEYFQNGDVSYIWSVSGDTDKATCAENADGTYTVTWSDSAEVGDTILITATGVTYDSEGNVLESAAGAYTIVYGMTEVEFTVRKNSTAGDTVSGADVAIYDSEGSLVSSGTTDSNGKVSLWLDENVEYTIEVSYTESSSSGGSSSGPGGSGGPGGGGTSSSTTHYTYEGTYEYGDSTTLVITDSGETKYEHLDVKINVASEAKPGYYLGLAVLDYVEIYDEAGMLIYKSSTLTHNTETNDYNVLFSDANGENESHSINFYEGYTVVIAYEVEYQYYDDDGNIIEVITETYVASIDSSTTYLDDEYYAYDSTNAYRVYNLAFGEDITESEWNTALANGTMQDLLGDNYDENGICLKNLTYFDVAVVLCDSYGQTQGGIDITLGIDSLKKYSSSSWDITLRKTLEGDSMTDGEFSFGLYEATVIGDNWTKGSLRETGANTAADDENGEASSFSDIVYVFNVDMSTLNETNTYYFMLSEIKGDVENVIYDDTVYGVKVEVTVRSQTAIEITVEYYTLQREGNHYVIIDTFEPLPDTDGEGNLIYYVPFTNTYSEDPVYDVDILKTDMDGNPLEGAEFIVKVTTQEYNYEYASAFTANPKVLRNEASYDISVTEWSDGDYNDARKFEADDASTVSVKLTGCNNNYTYYLSSRTGAHSGIPLEAGTYNSDGTYDTEYAIVEAGVEYYIYRKSVESYERKGYAVFRYSSGGEYYLENIVSDEVDATVIKSGEDGWILTNLPEGAYEIIEVNAPEGYKKLETSITFTVDAEGVHWDGDNGDSGADIAIANEPEDDLPPEGTPELPSSGGTGTGWFYLTGLWMVLMTGILIVTRKRLRR